MAWIDESEGQYAPTRLQAGQAEQLEAVNERFNDELERFKSKTLKPHEVLHLGKPLAILQAAGIEAKEINLAQPTLGRKLQEHGLTTDDLKNLAQAIQSPIMVYEWGTKAKSTIIVTELTTKDGRKITVALKAERNGKNLSVNEVASVHGKAAERFLSEMVNAKEGGLKDSLRYVHKGKALDWLGFALPNGASSQVNQELNSLAKVIQNFENPKPSGEKISPPFSRRHENGQQPATFARLVDEVTNESDAKNSAAPRFHVSPQQKRERVAATLGTSPDQLASHEPPTTPAKSIQRTGTAIVEKMIDKYQRLFTTIKEVERRTGRKTPVSENPYERLTKLSARAQAAVEDFANKTFTPLLKKISAMAKEIPDVWPDADVQKYAELAKKSKFLQLFLTAPAHEPRRIFDLYMVAKHAPHRNAYLTEKTRGRVVNGSGVTDEEAAAVVEIFERLFDKKIVDDFWQAVEKATDTSLNAWLDAGRISKEACDNLKAKLPFFVPLRSWDDSETDEAVDAIYSGASGGSAYSAYKEAKGRGTIADSPLAYIANLAQSAIVFREKNNAKKLLFNLAVKGQQPDLLTPKKGYTVETLDQNGSVVATREVATEPAALQPNERVTKTSLVGKTHLPNGKEVQHGVDVWIGGKLYTVFFHDEQVAREVNETTNAVAQWLNTTHGVTVNGKKYGFNIGATTKFMTSLMTQKNPVFWAKNTIRDAQAAALFLYCREGEGMTGKFLSRIPMAAKIAYMVQFADPETGVVSSDPVVQRFLRYYDEYRKSGSRVGFMQQRDIGRLKSDIDEQLQRALSGRKVESFGKKAINALNGLAAVSEDISRLATFFAARESGRSLDEASSLAKEVTVNFNRSGSDAGIPAAFYGFFNASIQAAANQFELFRVNPRRATAAAAVHTALGYLMYNLSAALLPDGDDDDLRHLSSYRKYINLFLPVGGGAFAQLPLSQAWRPFYAIGVAAAQVQHGELSAAEATLGVVEQFLTISPIELGGNPEQLAPTFVTPLLEAFVTRRNFMGAPLVDYEYNDPDGEKIPFHLRGVRSDQLPVWQHVVDVLAGDTPTGRASYIDAKTVEQKSASGLVDISPDQLRHLVISFTGGVGSATNDILNLSYALVSGGQISPNRIPLASGFYSRPAPRYYTSKYYRLKSVYDKFTENLAYDTKTGRILEYADNPNLTKLMAAGGHLQAGQMFIDVAREKQLRKVFEVWDAGEKKLRRISVADAIGAKDREEVQKEVERVAKEAVLKVEPIFRELGIAY
ncbi:MAG: hypothetical protein LBH84_01855 [Prevotellaceae bacterium]|nr:hypothetical protein [Prevotellaceae bacterium]